jgi:gluconate 2-dehydrogenase gamma chain
VSPKHERRNNPDGLEDSAGALLLHSLTRRTFLRGSAGALAVVVAGRSVAVQAGSTEAPPDPDPASLEFFEPTEALTVEAIAERIWPESEESAGAREAGVLYYIDHALAGPYAGHQQQYRTGLATTDTVANERYGASFDELPPQTQDVLLQDMANGTATAGDSGSETQLEAFFATFRRHTMEGLFSDPIYLGNRDFAGWEAVGYPGAHYAYSDHEQQSSEPIDKPMQSLEDF